MAFQDYKADSFTGTTRATDRALTFGSGAGRAICGGVQLHSSVTAFTATTAAGDSIPRIASLITDPLNGSLTLQPLFGLIPTGGASQVVNYTSELDGQGKWPRLVVHDNITGYRAQTSNSQYYASGNGTVDFTVDTQPGDLVVLVGDDGIVGRVLTISNAGATVHSNTLEFAATVPAASSGSSTRVQGSVSSSGAYRFVVVVLIQVAAPDTTAPTITGPSGANGATSAINIPENTTAVHTFTANEAVTWDLNGGADVARFTINAGGALSFLSAPNFEAPNDTGTNNTYEVGVRATDGSGNATTQTLTVTVVNANEGPVITSNGGGATAAISVPENTTAVTTLTATDPDAGATLTWTIVGGADAARFQITGAALSFLAAPNFEVPTDVGANNVYDVTVQVSDGTLTDTQAIAVTVTDVGEAGPTFSALTDIIGEAGIALADGTTVYWTWFPSGRPGAMVSPVQGSGAVNSAGRATISHTVAGDGLVVIGRRPGPAVVNDRLFMQFLTLA